jgi:hypothetical protein
MRNLLALVLVGLLGWQGYRYCQPVVPESALHDWRPQSTSGTVAEPNALARPAAAYHCDGRTLCSQMASCEEATYFLRNCPDVKMDGDDDGVPCEKQWCGQ